MVAASPKNDREAMIALLDQAAEYELASLMKIAKIRRR
jgi:hypothetical protein